MQIFTPHSLWEGYDRRALPLSVTTLTREDGPDYTVRHVYFNGEAAADGCTRIYGALYAPKEGATGAGIVYAGEIGCPPDPDLLSQFLGDGFMVLFVDYAGYRPEERFTIYPRSLACADLSYSPGALISVPEDIKASCWYIWTTVLLRAFTFLESADGIDPLRIAYVGVKTGGFSVVKASYLTPEAAASVTIFNAGFLPDVAGGTDGATAYSAALDNIAYAAMTQNPLLIAVCSNPSDNSSQYMNEMFAAADCREVVRTVAARCVDELDDKTLFTIHRYLVEKTRHRAEMPPRLDAAAKSSEGALYVSLTLPAGGKKEPRLHLAAALEEERFLNWHTLPLTAISETEFFAKTEVYNIDKSLLCYAEAETAEGLTLSGETLTVYPKALGIKPHPIKATRLLFDAGEDGVGGWLVLSGRRVARVVSDANGIEGVTSEAKTLTTLSLSDSQKRGAPDSTLQLLLRAPLGGTLTVEVYAKNESGKYVVYTARRLLDAVAVWQKVQFSESGLHAADGTLSSWADAVRLTLTWTHELYVNSLIWI